MAVVVRQEQVIAGKVRQGIATYHSTRPVTAAQQLQAERLDEELRLRMAAITEEVDAGRWLSLKNKPGVVRLWWEVGQRLRAFAGEIDVGPEEDRQFLWRALYDHAPQLIPGRVGSRAARLQNSHFYYCYLLGKYPWDKVRGVGDWTSWVEIFDSERIRGDDRILDWLVDRVGSAHPDWQAFIDRRQMSWFRPLAKALRARFDRRDSKGLESDELYGELDEVFASLRADPRA
jgi:hypothetical protein